MNDRLCDRHCVPNPGVCSGPTAKSLLERVDPGWCLEPDATAITRELVFEDYHHTMAFVNAVAYVAHTQDHHPELWIGYDRVRIRYTTHSTGGLTENDFICAARIDALG